MLPLAIGTLLAIGALAYVLFPIFVETPFAPRRRPRTEPSVGNAAEEDAVVALREIEFDRATGKLSDSDYDELRARYTERALAAMRRGDAEVDELSSIDPVEAAVSRLRLHLKECVTCGPRPEPDAEYCSHCGKYLPGACGACGATVDAPGAAFCTACGKRLAA